MVLMIWNLNKGYDSVIKTSSGEFLDKNSCLKYLQRMTLQALIEELEYSRSTRNSDLEQLIMYEYYKKVDSNK